MCVFYYLVISLMLVGLFLFTAPTVHYSHVSFLSEGYEARSIVDYVRYVNNFVDFFSFEK